MGYTYDRNKIIASGMKLCEQIELSITHNASLGDGVGRHEGLPVYVPYTMEGDNVRVEIIHRGAELMRGRLLEILTPSPHRHSPACQYFGVCGGCSLQHLAPDYYRTLKEHAALRVLKDLKQPEHLMQPLIDVGAQSRRRVQWAVRVYKGEVILGYQLPKSHEVVGIHSCPVAVPALNTLLPTLQACIQSMKKPSSIASVALTSVQQGIDALLHLRTPLHTTDTPLLQQFARDHAILRIATQEAGNAHYHIIHQTAEPSVLLGDIAISLPVDSFLQASEVAQNAIIGMVQQHLQGCTQVVDIYAGCGTYGFPLHPYVNTLTAYEGAPEMVAAIHNAAHRHGIEQKITATCRDLFTSPLTAAELQHYDGAIINPPRNGALPQIKQLAKSGIPRIAMISCNPSTFTRDAFALIQAGYQLQCLTPVDQFVWSAHLEIVGLFARH
jgi:23S rRNA (uracil1939-C5)-methyltransferase